MSSITTDFRASGVVRTSAHRAADGVIAGYIHSLVQAAAGLAGDDDGQPMPARLTSRAYDCGVSRSGGFATRRRPALRRAPVPA